MKETRVFFVFVVDVDPDVDTEWNRWMDETHLPEVVAKGHFLSGRKLILREGSLLGRYIVIYEASDRVTVEKYLTGPGKIIGEDYDKRYGSTSRLSRLVLEQVSFFKGT